MKFIKRFLIGLLSLVAVLAFVVFYYLHYLEADFNDELKLPGLSAQVEVLYDDYAIPHIYAENEADLFYAFGYVHAQDRLFQMEVLRRLASGRLSEVFGEAAIPTDKFFRALDFRTHAQNAVDARAKNSPENLGLEAYIKGVNEYLENGKTPIEFTLAGIPKIKFTVEDVEMIVGYMGYTFEGAFQTEAVATYIQTKLGDAYLPDVMQHWPENKYRSPVDALEKENTLAAAKTLATMSKQLTSINNALPFSPFHGSNSWIISGSKTKSGKPILANDTHIEFSQPSVWYEAHLVSPTFEVYGNFLAGGPFPALGHNLSGGWGLTMFENDEADFYRERVNPENENQVWYIDHWEDMEVRQEIIKVKDGEDVHIEIKKTRHGYILNDAFEKLNHETEPVAFQWVYHQSPSKSLEVFYGLSNAKNAAEAEMASKSLTAPGLNIMWADTDGNIVWWAAGKLPIRPKHVNPNLILDGSSGKDEWLGYYDFDFNPKVLNPERGFILTANNQPEDMGNGLIPGYFVPANRAKRIEELLDIDKNDWTEEDLRAIINDVTSSTYPEMIDSLKVTINKGMLTSEAQELLNTLDLWDGSHDLEDLEPTIYYKFLYLIYSDALKDELGAEVFNAFEHSYALKRNTRQFFLNPYSPWWDNVNTPEKETRGEIFANALNQTAVSLTAQLGPDLDEWKWEKVHTLENKHPMGLVEGLDKIFNVAATPVPGGRGTINNMDFPMDSTGIYKVKSGPALRRIIDFGTPELGYSVLPTGQSGYFMSKHYDDQAKLFNTGGKRAELMNREMVEKVMLGKTIFMPE